MFDVYKLDHTVLSHHSIVGLGYLLPTNAALMKG
jgi:hypothetical protein